MRAHIELNKREFDPPSIIDIQQIAMTQCKRLEGSPHTFNGQRVWKIKGGEDGLFTFDELCKKFFH